MRKFPEGPIAIVALIAFSAWLFVALPLIYLPSDAHTHGEILGIKYGEWLLFIATVVLAWTTWLLVRGAEMTAERQLRAYVSVEGGTNNRQSNRRRLKFDFRPVLINNGATPAEDVRISSNIGVVPPIIPDGFDYNLLTGPHPSVTTIGARQSRIHTVIFNRNLSISEMRKIVKGEWGFHVYGTVSYRDVFKKQRFTNYSFMIFVPPKRQSSFWNYTEHHNDAE